MSNSLSLDEAVKKVRNAIETGGAIRFSGRCGVGKTSLCQRILADYPEETRDGNAFIVAPWSRESVDAASYKVLKSVLPAEKGISASQSRPVKTPDAMAFALLEKTGKDVRLLDATTQAKLVAKVMQEHVDHVNGSDYRECPICFKLKQYLDLGERTGDDTHERFKKVFLAPAFITKLRETFARFSELGIDINENMEDYVALLPPMEGIRKERARLSWEIVQGLRREYADKVKTEYPNFYDNSYMLIESRKLIETISKDDLPRFIVVDDCQDLNLATFYLLEELHSKGIPVILLGNDDESIQSYRGAFPDVLSILEKGSGFECGYSLESEYGKASETELLCNVAKNIGSRFEQGPIPERSGKPTSLFKTSDYFDCKIAKNEEEELDFLENDLVEYMLSTSESESSKSWGDLAVIANSNDFLHRVGKRLNRDHIPFKYTAVSDEATKDSPVVRGMLALMKLSYYSARKEESLGEMCRDSYSLAVEALKSPLFADAGTLANLFVIKNILQSALSALAADRDRTVELFPCLETWEQWANAESVVTHDRNLDAFFAFLLIFPSERREIFQELFDREANSDSKVNEKKKKRTLKPYKHQLEQLFDVLDSAQEVGNVPELFCQLWKRCDKAKLWQKLAIEGGPKSDDVNQWLDQLIRLQHLADSGQPEETVPEFCDRVSKAYIESDSLASVAPKDDRITLSSPSGAQSKNYKKVWVADLQEKSWNKSLMDDLFSTHLLEQIITAKEVEKVHVADNALQYVSSFEMLNEESNAEERYSNFRTFLVAATRGCSNGDLADQKTVFLAVDDQEHIPYQILKGAFASDKKDGDTDRWKDCRIENSSDRAELNFKQNTIEGLSNYCRIKLAEDLYKNGDITEVGKDAAYALKYLCLNSKSANNANPKNWNFLGAESEFNPIESEKIEISSSSVDRIWADPVAGILGNRKYTGPTKSNPALQFGKAVHYCAQWATQEGKDKNSSDWVELSAELMDEFDKEFKRKLSSAGIDLSPLDQDRYQRRAKKAMDDLAIYFTNSPEEEPPLEMPILEKSEAEQGYSAEFSLKDIYEGIVCNTDELRNFDKSVFVEALEYLAGFDNLEAIYDKKIVLKGQIDRLDQRGDQWEVIDYKTGPYYFDKSICFSNLQLFCYQLIMHCNGKDIEKSMLFSVEKEDYPATCNEQDISKVTRRTPTDYREAYYQPCIFKGKGFASGLYSPIHYNADTTTPKVESLLKVPSIDQVENPLLKELKAKNGQLLPWVLYMLAKFFYVARYIDSTQLQMRKIKDGKVDNQDLIEKVMTVYGMCATREEENYE